MEAVIPPEVLKHIESVSRQMNDTDGWWTTRDLADSWGCAVSTVRRRLRPILSNLEIRRVTLTEEEAHARGNLGAGSVRMYRIKREAA